MNETDFIQEIMKQANLSDDQGGMVNEFFQSNFIAGNKNMVAFVSLIAEKLGVEEAQADQIYNIAACLIAGGILHKVKGIFKR